MKNGECGAVYQEVTRDKNISVEAKGVYAYLSSIAKTDNQCHLSMDTITHEMGITHARARKYINELINHGKADKRPGNEVCTE